MKNKLIFSLWLLCFAFSYSLKAQLNCNYVNYNNDILKCDIFTPKNSQVISWIMDEEDWYVKKNNDEHYKEFPYLNLILLETFDGLSSTRRFNCHGYAWIMNDGGPARWTVNDGRPVRWLGYELYNRDPDIYITDSSYIEVPAGTHPAILFWDRPAGDHSALSTEYPDTIIAKWNWGPLVKHHICDYTPFGSGPLKYYMKAEDVKNKPPIVGPYEVEPGGSIYSLFKVPSGISRYWSTDHSDYFHVHENSDGSATVTPLVHQGQIGTISASVDGGSVYKTIKAPGSPPAPPEIYGFGTVCYNGSSFTLLHPPSDTIYWAVSDTTLFSVNSTGNPTTVSRKIGTGAGNAMLSAYTGNVGEQEVASMQITACVSSIYATNNEVCYNGSQFALINPPLDTIYWTVSDTTLFYVNSTGNPTTVSRIGTVAGSAMLTAYIGSAGGLELASMQIMACVLSISAPNNEVCYGGSQFELLKPPPETIYWAVGDTNIFTVAISGNPTTVTLIGAGTDSTILTAFIGGQAVATKTIKPCVATINGNGTSVCPSGALFTITNPPVNLVWTVTGPFSFDPFQTVTSTTNGWVYVFKTNDPGNSGYLYARMDSINGTIVATKPLTTCTSSCVSNYKNQTVTTNTTITGCGGMPIYVENVTVTNGAKLTIISSGDVIFRNFKVEPGSQYEIIK